MPEKYDWLSAYALLEYLRWSTFAQKHLSDEEREMLLNTCEILMFHARKM